MVPCERAGGGIVGIPHRGCEVGESRGAPFGPGAPQHIDNRSSTAHTLQSQTFGITLEALKPETSTKKTIPNAISAQASAVHTHRSDASREAGKRRASDGCFP
jgi:hypothetical protein